MAFNGAGISAGSQTNVGGGGAGTGAAGAAGSSSSSSSSSSLSSSSTTELKSSDTFGFGELPQIVGAAGRKKRELPEPVQSSSFIDTLVIKKRNAASK